MTNSLIVDEDTRTYTLKMTWNMVRQAPYGVQALAVIAEYFNNDTQHQNSLATNRLVTRVGITVNLSEEQLQKFKKHLNVNQNEITDSDLRTELERLDLLKSPKLEIKSSESNNPDDNSDKSKCSIS